MTTVAVEDREGVALVTVQRPPANALKPELLALCGDYRVGGRAGSGAAWMLAEAKEAAPRGLS